MKNPNILCRLLQITCLILGIYIQSHAQNPPLQEFVSTDIAAGMETRCAMRDRFGFIWVGTTTGLNCYDGNGKMVYGASSRPVMETSGMLVSALAEVGDDILFGGNYGLYVFDRRSNSISEFPLRTQYKVQISSMIEKILVTHNKVWMGTEGQGVFMFDTADSTLVQNSRHGSFYSDLVSGADGLIYAASLYGEIHSFDPKANLVYSVKIPGHRIDKNRISLAASGRDIWIASGESLYRLDTASRTVEPVETSRATGLMNTLLARPDGTILIGGNNGLCSFNAITHELQPMLSASTVRENNDLRVTGLFENINNEVLIVHPTGPLDVLSLNAPSVSFVPLPTQTGATDNLNQVHALLAGNDGSSFWIGSDTGLYRFSVTPEGGFQGEHIAATGNMPVTSLTVNDSELWVGTGHSGIFVLDDRLQLKRNYVFDEKVSYSVVSNEINSIFRSKSGDIFILTNWGICRYDKANDYFLPLTEFSQHTRGTAMAEDRKGGQWIATTNNGLSYRSDSNAQFLPASQKIASQPVTDLFVDSRQRLWAVTKSHGLFVFDEAINDFRQAETPMFDGKPVSFIAEDDSHQIWAGVNNMLVNVRDNGDSRVSFFSHYPDATPTLNLTPLSRKGTIIIGGRNGFYTLEPAKVKSYSGRVKVLPLSLSLPNIENSLERVAGLGLDKPLYTMESIELPHACNSLTIGFAAIRPAIGPPIRYDYILEGIDKAWVSGSSVSEVTYNNLDPGAYTLLMRPHGIKNASVSRLQINILPPWYKTLWAKMLYVLLASLLGWAIFILARRLMRRSFQRRIKDLRIQKEREVFEAKSRYFVDLVHEIRTPLMLISMPLEQLSEQEKTDGAAQGTGSGNRRRYLASMRRNIDYLLGITNQLLDFRKAENNSEIKLSLTNCDLSAMLRAIAARFDEPLKTSGKEICITMPDGEVRATIDADKTERLLMNLIGNAMKYARKHIDVTMCADGDNVEISVSDDGPGVPANERDKIFDTYYQIGNDNVAATLGTGLGLAYAKLIATAHHGNITVDESEGGGARFILSLPKGSPISAESIDTITDTAEDDLPAADEADRNIKLLLAEDNSDLRQMISNILSRYYTVITATDGVDALEKTASENPDLIVSDVMMPRMDGMELCRRIKGDINSSHIPFIILTARTDSDSHSEGMQCGADIYLEKPFPIRQLVRQIANILRTRRLYYEKMKGTGIEEVRENLDGSSLPAGLNRIDAEFMEKMNHIIEESLLDDDFSIDRLAERLNLSRSSFYRKITALAGMAPNDYLKIFKLNYAARLLCEGYRVTEVTYRIGFTSSSYFAKCFKERFGMLPKEYVASQASVKDGQ